MALPGSMRAYAETLQRALDLHARDIDVQLLELAPKTASGPVAQRLELLMLPIKARLRGGRAPDVWHVLDGSRAYVAAGLRRAPVVVTVHDIIPWLQAQGRFAAAPATGTGARWLWRRNANAMRKAAALICVSHSTESDTRDSFGVAAHTCHVVASPLPRGLSGELGRSSKIQREAGIMLHVGHNGFYKNRAQVLRIFARLEPTIARQLVMIGPPATAELHALAGALGIHERVRWLGDADDALLADWYRRAAVLVFPSLYEGYGWPVLEAMAFGLPVVCSNAGSLPEVAGDVVPCVAPDDIDGFVTHIELLLREPARAAAASASGLQRAAAFSSERFAHEMTAVYRLAAATPRERRQG
ncbi:MAG: glycosyltransferase family 4 protein [Xanthomonadales bacterium]|nr:glycosyltransferase family 4 protein [Xanthomonadales bacterium]